MLLLILLHASGAAAPIEVAHADGAHVQRPTWSPDGARLAWEANRHERQEISLWVGPPEGPFQRVAPATSPSSALTAGFVSARPGPGVVHELSWSPPAMGRFVYAAANDASDYDLYVAGGGALAAAPGADGGAAWSPDGRWIAFTSARSGEGDLYLIDVQEVERPPRRLTSARGSSELYAAWSPDARSLVYVGHSDRGDNLWLLPSLDAAPVRLTAWGGDQIRPSFSPDGALVAFYANREDPGRFDLYVIPPRAGAAPRKLAEGVLPDPAGPSWTPDGAHLVVVLDDDAAYDPVAAVPVGGGAPRRLDLGTVGHGDLDVVARDGRPWLAWVAQGRTTDTERAFKRLYVAPLELP